MRGRGSCAWLAAWAAAAFAQAAQAAQAQSPASPVRSNQAVLEVVVDRRTVSVLEFQMQDGEPFAPWPVWHSLGLRVAPDAGAGPAATAALGLHSLRGVSSRIDAQSQTLHIDHQPGLLPVVQLGDVPPRAGVAMPTEPGLVLDYDALVQATTGDARSPHSALLNARGFGRLGVLQHAVIVSGTPGARALRLDTRFTHAEPDRMRRWRVGDFVTGALGWSRPLRLAGVQLMNDFAMRPDLVNTPSPQLAGTVAVPSTVEVLVNGVRRLSQAVEPGGFEVRPLPLVNGAGDVVLVVRDTLGRETVQSLPFYAAPRQLAPGLSEYSLELGRVRRHYGLRSNDYGPLVAMATVRSGVNPDLTAEGHLEATRGTLLVGGSGGLTVPGLGEWQASVAASGGPVGAGRRWSATWQRQTARLHLGAGYTRTGEGFRDVAATQGEALPRRSLRLHAGSDLGRWGSASVAFVATSPAAPGAPGRNTALRLLSLNHGLPIAHAAHLQFSAYATRGADRAQGVTVSLSLPLGPRLSASSAYRHDSQGAALLVQGSRQAIEPDEFGWRLQSEQRLAGAAPSRTQAAVDYRSAVGHLAAAAERVGAQSAARLEARGSLVHLAGGWHATPTVGDSFALVQLPDLPGVAIYRENRFVGRTGADGQLVVPDLLPYQNNRLGIDPLDLPMDADVESSQAELRPVELAGVVLRFGLQRTDSALLVLHDSDGRPLPLGAVLTPLQPGAGYPVGHDGQVWVRALADRDEFTATWQGRRLCSVRLDRTTPAHMGTRIGPLTCR